jgi:hypothetical protein
MSRCPPTTAPWSSAIGALCLYNAAPEWQARSYCCRCRLVGGMSTPGGLFEGVASPQAAIADLHFAIKYCLRRLAGQNPYPDL